MGGRSGEIVLNYSRVFPAFPMTISSFSCSTKQPLCLLVLTFLLGHMAFSPVDMCTTMALHQEKATCGVVLGKYDARTTIYMKLKEVCILVPNLAWLWGLTCTKDCSACKTTLL